MGYPNTKIHSKVFRRDTSVFPERSAVRPGQHHGRRDDPAARPLPPRVVNAEASDEMLEHLRACEDQDKFTRFVPAGTKIAFKTGSLDAAKTAAGIIEWTRGPSPSACLTSENEDHRWIIDNAGNRLCAEVAREVFDHSTRHAPATGRRQSADYFNISGNPAAFLHDRRKPASNVLGEEHAVAPNSY